MLAREKYFVPIKLRNYAVGMKTVWGVIPFMEIFSVVKLISRLSCNLIYHVLSMRTPDNLQTNFATKSP